MMKAKKSLLVGMILLGLAVSGFAAYRQFNSGAADCCFPACCTQEQSAECCKIAE
ncbi:MAG: hypothetical protein IPL27_19475 [Lewinellaceae bacterium]|nr:hypothetical protein [Lewinellaceae bacterium]